MQSQLLKEIYTESGIAPSQLTYMELHGTGTKVGDGEELQAVETAIVQHRQAPLLIGSVKSNIGHAEPASGMSSLIKAVIAMEESKVAPNMHLKKIKSGFTSLEQGKLVVATEITPIGDNDAVIGVSNFGFGGNNCHVILKRVSQIKPKTEDDVPRLVCVSGRTKQAVEEILKDVKKREFNTEYVAMLHQLFKNKFPTHLYRGYTIVGKNGSYKTSIRQNDNYKTCLVNFGKFEENYKRVAQFFLLFPSFLEAMKQINSVLLNQNLNIFEILLSEKISSKWDFLGSVATQIGITETLRSIKVEPKANFEDSTGKLVCAYFYKFVTLEEVLEIALNLENSENNKFQISTALNRKNVWLEPDLLLQQDSLILNVCDSDKMLQQGVTTFLDFVGRYVRFLLWICSLKCHFLKI